MFRTPPADHPPHLRDRRNRLRIAVFAALLAVAPSLAEPPLRAGSLASVAPSGASAGVDINITGTGFNTTASNNEVRFTHSSGAVAVATGNLIQTVSAAQGLRRLRVTIPAGLPAGTTALRVRNIATGETSVGQNVEIVSLSLPAGSSFPRGASQIGIRIAGSANSRFQAANSRAVFGAGITVHSTTVESPTSLVASVSIAATAPLGLSDVSVISPTQTAMAASAFSIVDANRPPAFTSTAPVDAREGQPYGYQVTAADPDGDAVSFRLIAAPAGMTITSGAIAWTPTAAQAGTQSVEVEAADTRGGTARQSFQIAVRANRAPAFTSTPITAARETEPYAYQTTAADPDGDSLAFRLTTAPAGMTISGAGAIAWVPSRGQAGTHHVVVEASDAHGGTTSQPFDIAVSPVVTIESIEAAPHSIRFDASSASRQIEVAARRSDGTTISVAPAASGTTYTSSNPFVASISTEGLVTSVANGTTIITVRNGALVDTASVVVEIGVALVSLDVTPPVTTLRSAGAIVPLRLTGRFSDGSTRDLTTVDGATYVSSAEAVARVDATGRVTAMASGDATIAARYDTQSTTAVVHVAITAGIGYVRGEVYDDSRGLPLAGATVSLVSDGAGPLAAAVTTTADDRGRYVLAGRTGEAVVRITKSGFTAVERRGLIAAGSAATLLDGRLTPVTAATGATSSAFGGAVRDETNHLTLQVAPGGVAADTPLTVTAVSPQGLAGRLPYGWSPVAAAAVEPADVQFGSAATLTLPNAADIGPGTLLTLARYSPLEHEWIDEGPVAVSADRLSIASAIHEGGQFAVIAPDAAPNSPPGGAVGSLIAGVPFTEGVSIASATGDVVPRSAPAGEGVRAVGRIGVAAAAPLPSGVVVQARVNERFDLLDQTQVVTQPFTQDIVVYALPRPPTGGSLGAAFPITPSRSFTIQQLMLGVVRLDVTPFTFESGVTVADADGGSVSDDAGDTLDVPAGVLAQASAIQMRRLGAAEIALTLADLELLAAIRIEAGTASFSQPASLSMVAPADVAPDTQIFLAQLYADPFAVRRLRLVAVAHLLGGRLVSERAIAGLTLTGVNGEGDYVFLRPTRAYGFTSGRVTGPGGSAPRAGALVTSSSGPFSDISQGDGGFIVASPAAVADSVRALDPSTRAAAVGTATPAVRDAVFALNLPLVLSGLTVVNVSPPAGAANVPLDTSVTIDFASAVDAASVTEASAAIQAGDSTVALQRTVSADRRRLTLRPTAPLAGKTSFSIVLTPAIRDTAGNPLAGYSPALFTTLDPTHPASPTAGQIVAELPDEGGAVVITGAAGTSGSKAAIVGTNLRTQETVAIVAAVDGSFYLRVAAAAGDEIALTFRDSAGRDTTITLTQFRTADGSTAIGPRGGSVTDATGRTGRIIPNALSAPGLFRLDAGPADSDLPALPGGFEYVDRFTLQLEGAAFNRVSSLTLTESQSRFPAASAVAPPFAVSGTLTVPGDFLTNTSLRFTAVAQDTAGNRQTASLSTVVVSSSPDTTANETLEGTRFPVVRLASPRESIVNQQVETTAIAPAARVELDVPLPAATNTQTVLLTRLVQFPGGPRLAIADRLAPVGAGPHWQTSGSDLPGMNIGGGYVVVSSAEALVFVKGQASGPTSSITADGLPFVFETDRPNGYFALPVRAGAPFTIRFFDPVTGAARGSMSGVAPESGTADLGSPLSSTAGTLQVRVDPADNAVVDIGQPASFRFSEPLDPTSLTANAVVITDASGSRVFGTTAASDDRLTVTFQPARRWRYGNTYRWTVATSVTAVSGAGLRRPASGTFTTFAPVVIGTANVAAARDVASTGALAVAATPTGFTVLDVASPDQPRTLAVEAVEGGVNALVFTAGDTAIVDRNGQAHTGSMLLVAAGSQTTAGRLLIYDLTLPSAPALIGSTQLTRAPGTIAPEGVPDVVGRPGALNGIGDGRALVAVENAGVASVLIGNAIPADPSRPALGLTARYAGAGSAFGAAALTNRLVSLGGDGLSVLDVASLTRTAGLAGVAGSGLAVLNRFSSDLNGDGRTTPASETVDLALVTGGSDGTVQFYEIPETGDPRLLSVVRLPGVTSAVALDATERLAYVAVGVRGVAILDLDGPASVQPIDVDRDGTDDRVLGFVATQGTALRVSTVLARGLGFAANGPGGVATVQLLPPRTTFLTLDRDPVNGPAGDEESILETHTAFTTDAALLAEIEAAVPPREELHLVIEEVPEPGGARLLSFPDGTASTPLTNGLNSVAIRIADGVISAGSRATLRVQNAQGGVIAAFELTLRPLSDVASPPDSMVLPDESPVLTAAQRSFQLSVGGVLPDGTVVNITRSGTTYSSEDPRVATVDANGLVTAVAGGTVRIHVRNGQVESTAVVRVDLPIALVDLEISHAHYTLTSLGTPEQLQVRARYSDGTRVAATAETETLFTTSDPSILAVDTQGRVTALREGSATVTAVSGGIQRDIEVTVELRTPPVITGLTLEVIRDPVLSSLERAQLKAVVTGSGSLDGLDVSFVASGAVNVTVHGFTEYEGVAGTLLMNLSAPGPVSVVASVVSPTTGVPFTASAGFAVERGVGDSEPNDTIATAADLPLSQPVSGSIGGGDARDRYRIAANTPGALTTVVSTTPSSTITDLTLRLLSADGAEFARFVPTASAREFTWPIVAGETFVDVESSGGATPYTVMAKLAQDAVSVQGVSPLSGPPATPVTITGSGFSLDPSETRVLFGGVVARLLSATGTTLEALVPAGAVDGPVEVISANRRAIGPTFTAGNTAELPRASERPNDPAMMRRDPITGNDMDVTRLSVTFDPLVARATVDALAQSLGGELAGAIPALNSYVFEFAANRSIRGLAALAATLRARADVSLVANEYAVEPRASDLDLRTLTQNPEAFTESGIFDALDAIRDNPRFTNADALHQHPVRVAIIDSGFNPADNVKVEFGLGDSDPTNDVVKLMLQNSCGDLGDWADVATTLARERAHCPPPRLPHTPSPTGLYDFPSRGRGIGEGHGTAVAGIIGALNDGTSPLTGVLNGVFKPGEKPFQLTVYAAAAQSSDGGLIRSAIGHLAGEPAGQKFHVVNLSWGDLPYQPGSPSYNQQKQLWKDTLTLLAGDTLFVVAAGNKGLDIVTDLPAALAAEMSNVVAVGGTGVGGEAAARAQFTAEDLPPDGSSKHFKDTFDGYICPNPPDVYQGGSSCGRGLTIVAPAVNVLVADNYPQEEATHLGLGTSFAAPLVTGIAALMQVVRPSDAVQPFTPDVIKSRLVASATDITATFGTPARKLAAYDAISPLLATPDKRLVYVADQEAVTGVSSPGAVVYLDVDPITAEPLTAGDASGVILLKVVKGGQTLIAGRPRAVATSPQGLFVYAFASSEGALGDGIVVIDLARRQAVDFIPLSGSPFPARPGVPSRAFHAFQSRPSMVVSKDGRLLYVSTGFGIRIINTESRKLVGTWANLPAPYNANARLQRQSLQSRLAALERLVVSAGLQGPASGGGEVGPLELSADGRRLFIGVRTGSGPGSQPGIIYSFNVDLYSDFNAATRALESRLSLYMTRDTDVAQTALAPASDEPSGMSASPDGNTLYVANGGYSDFSPPGQTQQATQQYALTLATAEGLATDPNLQQAIAIDINEGVTILNAPGAIDVLSTNQSTGHNLTAAGKYASNVNVAWAPSSQSGGPVLSTLKFGQVYAKVPTGISIRPGDGTRALVSFGQSGNFGVLDRGVQSQFTGVHPSDPTRFGAVVGVTQAIQLNQHLWPERGMFIAKSGERVDSPDERLMFPSGIQYAQSGRFAAAVHTGAKSPRTLTVTLPAFSDRVRFSLNELGFNIAAQGTSGTDPATGHTVTEDSSVTFERGGGGVSIINDKAVADDVRLNAGTTRNVGEQAPRAYYAAIPVCESGPDQTHRDCQKSAVTTVYTYTGLNGTRTPFARPIAVTVAPIAYVASPRFGDHIQNNTEVIFGCACAPANSMNVQIFPLDAQTGAPSAEQLGLEYYMRLDDNHSSTARFEDLSSSLALPGRYRIVAIARTPGGAELSRAFIDVTFVR